MIDYIAVDKNLRKDVLDAKTVRRMYEVFYHYVISAKIKIKGKWDYVYKYCLKYQTYNKIT